MINDHLLGMLQVIKRIAPSTYPEPKKQIVELMDFLLNSPHNTRDTNAFKDEHLQVFRDLKAVLTQIDRKAPSWDIIIYEIENEHKKFLAIYKHNPQPSNEDRKQGNFHSNFVSGALCVIGAIAQEIPPSTGLLIAGKLLHVFSGMHGQTVKSDAVEWKTYMHVVHNTLDELMKQVEVS